MSNNMEGDQEHFRPKTTEGIAAPTIHSTPEEDKAKIEAFKNTAPKNASVLAQKLQGEKRIKRLQQDLNVLEPSH